ncbi:acylneuraminate cytidylyltransferase [Brevibacterium sp. BRM-1]|uniref:acylneuraminate cytidylyltransferase n=1 Tax=Brevibacterium sp. BRM-1 TaxID=2999062 RepID=UPI00227DB57C|nr:acylneuraminate cytidylyltransferase [Brevibacterium sp. BRM-1]WAL40124.1 acylneuraminate cytidylyltransferase [Brevibacterium sp. BRM-1]
MTETTKRPRTAAIIPARGGSKGIPLKNLQKIAGKTLLARAIDAARAATGIDLVVVSTDHDGIAAEAERAGARVVRRPDALADDHATSESALIHALGRLGEDIDITVFIQATSPFINPENVDAAIARVAGGGADVVFSAVEDHSFLWTLDASGGAVAVGHDAAFRPRRQDRPRHFNETGAFYVMRTQGLLAAGHRFFGRIEVEEVPAEDAREIDTLSDLTLLRAMAAGRRDVQHLDVDAVVTDFDGVHTDDAVLLSEDGTESVRVHRGDGMGVAALVRAGVPFLILSKERNPVVTRRAQKLRVDVAQGIDDKATAIEAWMRERGLDPERVAYVGNDINDLAAFSAVGWPIAVADAHPAVLAAARTVLEASGGQGAVREVCDLVLGTGEQPLPATATAGRTGTDGRAPAGPEAPAERASAARPAPRRREHQSAAARRAHPVAAP